jgi:hypothetical protein
MSVLTRVSMDTRQGTEPEPGGHVGRAWRPKLVVRVFHRTRLWLGRAL